uniref:KRMPlx5 n=1 Tax=Pinctada maxima TaxID=104660 RepID=M1RM35_PINMA|nr:KRMPlx5 [Pinctada maxima]
MRFVVFLAIFLLGSLLIDADPMGTSRCCDRLIWCLKWKCYLTNKWCLKRCLWKYKMCKKGPYHRREHYRGR